MIRSLAAALCVVSLACLGCGDDGPKLGKVTGTVTMDGTPMTNVLVTFTPVEGGRSSNGKTDDSGVYSLTYSEGLGAAVGMHRVSVTTLKNADNIVDSEMRSDDPAYAAQSGGAAQDYSQANIPEAIPEKYNRKTELQFEVESGSNTIDIPLTSN